MMMYQFLGTGRADSQAPKSLGSLKHVEILIYGFVFVLIAMVWIAVIEKTRFERQDAITAAIRQNVNRVVALEQYTMRLIETADRSLLHIKEHLESEGRIAAGSTPLHDSLSRHPIFAAVSIFDDQGRQIASSVEGGMGESIAGKEAFEIHRSSDSGDFHLGVPVYSSRLGGDFLWMTRRLNRSDGSFAGVVGVQIAPRQFTDFYRNASFGKHDLISVIGLDGVTRARRTGDTESHGEDLSGKLVMRMQEQNPNGTYLGPSVLDGIHRYFSHRRLKTAPIFVTSGMTRDEILAPIRNHARWYYAGATIVSLTALGFMAILILGLRQRRLRALEIAAAAERLERAHRLARTGDWEFDFATGEIHWSPQLCELMGRDPSRPTLRAEEYIAYLHEGDRRIITETMGRSLATKEPQEFEYRSLLQDGTIVWHRAVAVPTIDESGTVTGLHGVDQDITQQKLLEKLQIEVEHLSRLEAMNTMAATLAHELNQPLAAAANYLTGSRRLLEKGKKDTEQARNGIVHAIQQVMLAGDIIRRARDMISNRPKHASPFSLKAAVADAVALISATKDAHGAAITQDVDARAGSAIGDRIQIQQVLVNLIRNACEAVSDRENPKVSIKGRRKKGEVIVSVSDNGPGIPYPKALFSPFRTEKPQGLGLGLSISRTIVEAHGGRIWVAESGGSGTTISFSLPAEPLQATAKAA